MLWTKEEQSELRRQIKAGARLEEILIDNRTASAIRYQVYRLRLNNNPEKWKKVELRQLKDFAKNKVNLHSIEIPGRTKIAIRGKLLRMGILKTKKRTLRSWSTKEIKLLKHLVVECGYTSRTLFTNKWFPGRSKDSIAQQMRRLHIKKSW